MAASLREIDLSLLFEIKLKHFFLFVSLLQFPPSIWFIWRQKKNKHIEKVPIILRCWKYEVMSRRTGKHRKSSGMKIERRCRREGDRDTKAQKQSKKNIRGSLCLLQVLYTYANFLFSFFSNLLHSCMQIHLMDDLIQAANIYWEMLALLLSSHVCDLLTK